MKLNVSRVITKFHPLPLIKRRYEAFVGGSEGDETR